MAGLLSGCDWLTNPDLGRRAIVDEAIRAASARLGVGGDDLPRLDADLHPKQRLALSTDATELLYGGAAGGGKSFVVRISAIELCRDVPRVQVYLFRRNLKDIQENHLEGEGGFRELLAPWVANGFAKITGGGPWTIRFGNGARIVLDQCERYAEVYNKYQGAEIHQLTIDELTQVEEPVYRFLRSRVRLAGLRVPDAYLDRLPRIFCCANPGGIGHNWVRRTWILGHRPGEVWRATAKEGGMFRQFIPARLEDNPTIASSEAYRQRLQGLGDPVLVAAMLEGNWDIIAGGAMDDVWNQAVHVVEPFKVPQGWHLDRSFDWGSAKPYAVCYWAESNGEAVELPDGSKRSWPRGTLFLIAEVYGSKGAMNEGTRETTPQIADKVKAADARVKEQHGGVVRPGPADSSIFDEGTEDGVSIAEKYRSRGVLWVPANKGPGSRKAGLQLLRDRLEASQKLPMEDPGLFIFSTCRAWIDTVPVLPRDKRDREDVDTTAEDHLYDATRYRLSHHRASVGTAEAWF